MVANTRLLRLRGDGVTRNARAKIRVPEVDSYRYPRLSPDACGRVSAIAENDEGVTKSSRASRPRYRSRSLGA